VEQEELKVEVLGVWALLLAVVWALKRDLIRDLKGMAHGLDLRQS
jgi:hypothetical protein